jgi:hypothetical protein
LLILQNSAGFTASGVRVSVNKILDGAAEVWPIILKYGVVRVIQGLAVGLENATGVAI